MEFICKKIGGKIGFFKRIRNRMSIITSINIYNTIIKPHFEFEQIIKLKKLKYKAIRAILKVLSALVV